MEDSEAFWYFSAHEKYGTTEEENLRGGWEVRFLQEFIPVNTGTGMTGATEQIPRSSG